MHACACVCTPQDTVGASPHPYILCTCALLVRARLQALLAPGKGWGSRDCESGQLLVDRGRHLDALEVAFWANSFDDLLYSLVCVGAGSARVRA